MLTTKPSKIRVSYAASQIHMAHLAIIGGHSVNGVAKLHTELLKEDTLRDFYKISPEKFNNKTNGIVQRRWTQIVAPHLSPNH